MKHFRTTAVLLGLAVYAVAFYATPLSDARNDDGQPLSRVEVLVQLLLLPDKWLLPRWFGTPAGFSLFDRLPVLLVAVVILAWATVLGWLLMAMGRRGIARLQLTRLETTVFSAAVGLSALSTWVLLLGLFGVMGRFWMFTMPSLLTLIAAGWVWCNRCGRSNSENESNSRGLTARGRDAASSQKETNFRGLFAPGYCNTHGGTHGNTHADVLDNTLSTYWLWLGVPFVLMIVLAGMVPPLDFDVREYHLQAPKEFFQQGQITFLPHNVYANMTLGTEMLSLLAMVIAGDWWLGALAGKTVIAAFTPLTALALVAAGRRFFTLTAGVVAALVYISVPWVVSIASGGFVEGASACYLFLAVYALLLLEGQSRTRGQGNEKSLGCSQHVSLLALAGYLAGAAVATKYPAVLFVLSPLAAWVVLTSLRKSKDARSESLSKKTETQTVEGGKSLGFSGACRPQLSRFCECAKPLAVFLLAATVGCGLWFGKNWVLTGNPTYPLLYEVFDGKSWTAEKEQQWNRVHRPHDFSTKTLGKDLGRVVLTSDWLSPLTVPLVVLAFVGVTRRRRIVWVLLAYALFVIGAWWLCTHRIDRFWIPILPVLALLAGVGACWTTARWWRWVLLLLLVGGLGANFLVASIGPANAWFVRLTRLRNAPGWIDPWHQFFNAHAADGRVLTVGDAAVFDLERPVFYNTCFDDCIFEQLVKGRTTDEVRAELAARQIAYVYVQWGEIDRYRRTYGFTDFVEPEVFDRLVAEGVLEPLPPIPDHPGRAYRVKGGPPRQLVLFLGRGSHKL